MATISSTGTSCSLKGTDWQGSLVNEATSSRALVAGFTPFGSSTHPGHGNTGFVGQPHEPVTGFYLLGNGYRAYSPTLMRFIAADDFSPFERGGLNAYVYCAADPLNNTDPDGHALLRSLSKLGQRIFSGRKAGDIAHLNEKYEAFVNLRSDAMKGLRTIKQQQTALGEVRAMVNFKRVGKFNANPNLTFNEQQNYLRGRMAGQDVFTAEELKYAAIRVGKALGRTNAAELTINKHAQKNVFSEGANAFNKRITRYKNKGALLPEELEKLKALEEEKQRITAKLNAPS